MRTLILTTLAAVVGLIALPAATAQQLAPRPAVPLPKGKIFTMKVVSVTSSKSGSDGFVPSGVKIPKSIPTYKVGDKIRFTIGDSSELKWKDRNLPLYGDYDDYISYQPFATVEVPQPDVALIYVNARNQPTRAEIYLYKKKSTGTVHTVFYELN